MSQITIHYCDICGNECQGILGTEGPMSKDGYSTRVEVVFRGKRNNLLDFCNECELQAIKRLNSELLKGE